MSKITEITASRGFDAPPDQVFDALTHRAIVRPLESKPGDVLEMIHLAGHPNQAGYQTAVRVNWGLLDYRYLETLTAYHRPHFIAHEHMPEACFPLDHTERLPPVNNRWTPEPERVFRQSFGADPQASHERIDLTRKGGQTFVEITYSKANPPGSWAWLQRRKDRRIAAHLESILESTAQKLSQP